MRKDIQVNTSTGDLPVARAIRGDVCQFQWIEDSDTHLIGCVSAPFGVSLDTLCASGVVAEIPYTPVFKPFKVRFTSGGFPIANPVDGTDLFAVFSPLYGGLRSAINASELSLVSDSVFAFQIDKTNGTAGLWSGYVSDMNSVVANIQNRNLLLRCVPSNNYRYPLSGVGLVRYLHGSLSTSQFADTLQREFAADKASVVSASFDPETGRLSLELDFSEANGSV